MAPAVIAGAWLVYERPPSSFLPEENRGVRMQMVPPPEGAARARTLAAVEKAEDFMPNRQGDAVASAFSSLGFSFQGSGRHAGMMFVKLKDDDERPDRTAAMNANGAMMRMTCPSSFAMQLLAAGGQDADALREARWARLRRRTGARPSRAEPRTTDGPR